MVKSMHEFIALYIYPVRPSMFHRKTKFIITVLIIFFISTFHLAINASFHSTKSKLKQVDRKIRVLQSTLVATKQQQSMVQHALKQSEVAINNLALETKEIRKKLSSEQRLLKNLQIQQNNYKNRLLEQKQRLYNETRALYMLGQNSFIKTLLNQEDPNQISRSYVYYQYLYKARVKTINAIADTLHKTHQNSRIIQSETKVLQDLRSQQELERKKLTEVERKRNSALKTLNTNLVTQKSKLQKLLADKKALEELFIKINSQKRSAIVSPGSLATLRGKLFSPANGKIMNAFSNSETRLNGILINSPAGTDVHAIASGQVVFANWLQGYGLLLIIDHGHGLMSLYGRNQSLYKKTNEQVTAGEVIATVGNSGGYEKTGLYFAMRYNGKPIDPTVWCRLRT
jgi:murein hydrolase activator